MTDVRAGSSSICVAMLAISQALLPCASSAEDSSGFKAVPVEISVRKAPERLGLRRFRTHYYTSGALPVPGACRLDQENQFPAVGGIRRIRE